MDDGFMEVVGLFGAAQMAALQVGDTGFNLVFYHFYLIHHNGNIFVAKNTRLAIALTLCHV